MMLLDPLHLFRCMRPVFQEDEAFSEGLDVLLGYEGFSPLRFISRHGAQAVLAAPPSAGTKEPGAEGPQQQQEEEQEEGKCGYSPLGHDTGGEGALRLPFCVLTVAFPSSVCRCH